MKPSSSTSRGASNHEIQPKVNINQPEMKFQNIPSASAQSVEESFEARLMNGSELLRACRFRAETFPTGIEHFDELFDTGGIFASEITELIGLPESGKTMLLNTILINILETSEDITIFFIDTKDDFQPIKLTNMMTRRGIPQQKQFQMLKKILVQSAATPDELILILKLASDNDKVKIVMIDSITVPFYFYLGHTMLSLERMTQVKALLKLLAKTNNCAVS
jgi:RecA/RadA recombinase